MRDTTPDMTDAEAIGRCRSDADDGRAAFRVLYDRYFDSVTSYTRRMLPSAEMVDEATQETFVRLYRSRERIDPKRPLRPYLLRIAHNVCLDLLKRGRRFAEREGGDMDEAATPSTAEAVEAGERQAAIARALNRLAPESRSLIVLRHVQGLKLKQLAELQDCTERTVRNRLRSAAVLFERALQEQGVLCWEADS